MTRTVRSWAHRPTLEIGARVRHYGEQYAEAREFGTATVLELKLVTNGAVEYLVQPLTGEAPRWWSDDATIAINRGNST